MANEMTEKGVGGPAEPKRAKRWKRVIVDIVELLVIPFVTGLGLGYVIGNAPAWIQVAVLGGMNAAWILFRDWSFSPGRWIFRLRLIDLRTGEKPKFVPSVVRNILIIAPGLVLGGYLGEFARVFISTTRPERQRTCQLIRRIWCGLLILLSLAGLFTVFETRTVWTYLSFVLFWGVLVLFIKVDRPEWEGDRLGDLWAGTRVVERS